MFTVQDIIHLIQYYYLHYSYEEVTNFLDAHPDVHGVRQSALWLYTNLGWTVVRYGTIIYHRLQAGIECYAEVVQFVARSKSEALFQVKLLGWQTPSGWYDQKLTIFSYVIVPLVRCHPEFSGPGWSYFSYDSSLQQLVLSAMHYVKLHLGPSPLTRVAPNDHITGGIINGFMRSPVMHSFGNHLATGVTVAMNDLHLPLSADIAELPSHFNVAIPSVRRLILLGDVTF